MDLQKIKNDKTQALNPYKGYDPTSGLSRFQQWLDRTGITNYAGKALQEADLLYRQWEAENSLKLEDREYNDFASQAERMRNAGINPDLNGVSGYESQMAGNSAGDDIVPPTQDEGLNLLSNIGSSLLQTFSTFVGLRSGLLDIQGKKIANASALFESGRNIASTIVGDENERLGLSYDLGAVEAADYGPYMNNIFDRKLRKAVRKYARELHFSPLAESSKYKGAEKIARARQAYLDSKSTNPLDNGDDRDTINAMKAVNDFYLKVDKETKAYQGKQAAFNSEMLDFDRSRGLTKQSMLYNNQLQGYQVSNQKFQRKLQSMTEDMYKKLDQCGFFGQLLKFNILMKQDLVGSSIGTASQGLSLIKDVAKFIK